MTMVPSAALIAAVAGLAALAAVRAEAALWAAGALAAAAGADWWLSRRRLAGISIAPGEPLRTYLRLPATLTLAVEGAPPGCRVAMALPAELGGEAEAAGTVCMITPQERGRYQVEAVGFETASRWRLWTLRRRVTPGQEIRVYPRIRGDAEMAALRRALLGARQVRQMGKGREFEKLREYSAGDSYQDIHWKATARRGAPMTKAYQIERMQEVYCLIDCGRLQARRQEGQTVLDWNLTAALHLQMAAERQGDRFGLAAFSGRVNAFLRARSGAAHFAACQETLFPLQPEESVTDFEELATVVRARLPRRSLLVILTSLDERAAAEQFVRAARLLAERHVVAVISARPAGMAPLFAGEAPREEQDLYAALGGHAVWRGMRQLELDLSRWGVRFAVEEPRDMGARALDLYEEIRKRQLV